MSNLERLRAHERAAENAIEASAHGADADRMVGRLLELRRMIANCELDHADGATGFGGCGR